MTMTSNMTWLMGIDPGVNGAIAIIDLFGRRLWLHDIPYLSVKLGRSKARNELQEAAVAERFRGVLRDSHGDLITTIEIQSPAPMIGGRGEGEGGFKQRGSPSSMNQQLGGYFMLRGIMTGLGISYLPVGAADWKRPFKLSKDKDESRHAASRLLPLCVDAFTPGKARADFAEATMIAIYGAAVRGIQIPTNIQLVSRERQRKAA